MDWPGHSHAPTAGDLVVSLLTEDRLYWTRGTSLMMGKHVQPMALQPHVAVIDEQMQQRAPQFRPAVP